MSQPPFPDPHSFWHAHPFYARSARFAHYSRRGRFFPRVFWFALGAGAYAWWSSHKEHRQRAIEGYSGGQEGSTGQSGYNHHGSWGWGCHKKKREVEERRSAERPADVRYDKQTTRAWENDSQLPVPTPLTTSAAAVPPAYAPSTAPVEREKETRQLPSDHFREVGRQASDAVSCSYITFTNFIILT